MNYINYNRKAFADTYVEIITELVDNIRENQKELQIQNIDLESYKKQAFENKNENLNSDGINENISKFHITILSVEFTNSIITKPGVAVQMWYEDIVFRTKKQNSVYAYNEKFEL